jgi:hypothetical protein
MSLCGAAQLNALALYLMIAAVAAADAMGGDEKTGLKNLLIHILERPLSFCHSAVFCA